jgi:hypothetical protein
VILLSPSCTLHFYPYFSKTKLSFARTLNSVSSIWIQQIKQIEKLFIIRRKDPNTPCLFYPSLTALPQASFSRVSPDPYPHRTLAVDRAGQCKGSCGACKSERSGELQRTQRRGERAGGVDSRPGVRVGAWPCRRAQDKSSMPRIDFSFFFSRVNSVMSWLLVFFKSYLIISMKILVHINWNFVCNVNMWLNRGKTTKFE